MSAEHEGYPGIAADFEKCRKQRDDLLAALEDAYAHVTLLGSGQVPPHSNAEMCERLGNALAKVKGPA